MPRGRGKQGGLVHITFADAFEVFYTPFVIEDERRYFVPKAFLEHEQPPNTPVAICEGMDALKAHMEVQDLFHIHRSFLVFLQDGGQRRDDILMRDTDLGLGKAEHSRLQFCLSVGIGAVCKDLVQVLDEKRRQLSFDIVDDMSHDFEMVDDFNDVICICGLKRHNCPVYWTAYGIE